MTTKDFIYALSQIPPVALEELLNTILLGVKKHGPDTMDKSDVGTELLHMGDHFNKLRYDGETHDKDDGQHHAAAIAVRCLKIIALDNKRVR